MSLTILHARNNRWSALEAIFLGEGSDVIESLPQEVARFLEVTQLLNRETHPHGSVGGSLLLFPSQVDQWLREMAKEAEEQPRVIDFCLSHGRHFGLDANFALLEKCQRALDSYLTVTELNLLPPMIVAPNL